MKILFLENNKLEYDGYDIGSNKLRGAEFAFIQHALGLSKLGHDVYIINNCKHNRTIDGVHWINVNGLEKNTKIKSDIAIANSDANLFKLVESNRNYIFSHSIQNLEKFIRKKQFLSYIKFKPKLILFGNYHFKKRSILTSFYGKIKLVPSVNDNFMNKKLLNKIPLKNAIFYSSPDRNLKQLLKIWTENIYPLNNDASLSINEPYSLNDSEKNSNILLRKKGNISELIECLLNMRTALIPGHSGEVYCNVAQECLEMCIPIVTFGTGALNDRVEHGLTGFVAKTVKQFIDYTHILLNDNKKWLEIRNNLIKIRGKRKWADVSFELNKIIKF